MLSNSYDFAKQYGITDGELKAVTWQANPGTVFYRRDIAKDALGTDDPDEVAAMLSDWDKFFETAETLKDKGYKITSGTRDILYAVTNAKRNAWVTLADDGKETFTIDDSITTYLEYAKKLYDNEYTDNAKMWIDAQWSADMTDDGKVFCYFGCPWFAGTMRGNGATDGNWAACAGPTSYWWGGTYISVGKDTPNPELCAFLLYELTCDPDISVEICNASGDCPNNIEANERLANGELSDENPALLLLGGQNPIEVYAANAVGVDESYCSYADGKLQDYINDASTSYNEGTFSIDDAYSYINGEAKKQLSLTVAE